MKTRGLCKTKASFTATRVSDEGAYHLGFPLCKFHYFKLEEAGGIEEESKMSPTATGGGGPMTGEGAK